MKIFVSWSGSRGKLVAESLRSWLPDVLHKAEPWVSSEDIEAGTRWSDEVARHLDQTRFGIVCLTPETAHAPWVMFEAGALAKTLGSSSVCPYLIQMSPRDLRQPLGQFDAVMANRSGTLKLVRSINRSLKDEGPLPDDRLKRAFERWWPDLEVVLDNIPPAHSESDNLPHGPTSLGLDRVFPSRSTALSYFAPRLRREIERSRRSRGLLYIAGTSMRGFLASDAEDFHGPRLLEQFVESGCDLRIMLTHPETADRRSEFEKRPLGAIADEVRGAITQLTTLGVSTKQIRYYRGSPTVFGVVTSEHMLLNPYPYENESHRCMTLVARKTEDVEDIYHQYLDAHFERPWEHAEPVEVVSSGVRRASKAATTPAGEESPKIDVRPGRRPGATKRVTKPSGGNKSRRDGEAKGRTIDLRNEKGFPPDVGGNAVPPATARPHP